MKTKNKVNEETFLRPCDEKINTKIWFSQGEFGSHEVESEFFGLKVRNFLKHQSGLQSRSRAVYRFLDACWLSLITPNHPHLHPDH